MIASTDEVLRLNLGSHSARISGFKNMDLDPNLHPEFVGDVSDLSRFSTGSIDEIFASHILEHFSHFKTVDVLTEWHRALKKGGILYLSVPDFSRAVELYAKYGMSDWIRNFVCGDQVYPTAFHYTIFDEKSLRRLLVDSGFRDICCTPVFPFPGTGCWTLTTNLDSRLVSLNMMAVK